MLTCGTCGQHSVHASCRGGNFGPLDPYECADCGGPPLAPAPPAPAPPPGPLVTKVAPGTYLCGKGCGRSFDHKPAACRHAKACKHGAAAWAPPPAPAPAPPPRPAREAPAEAPEGGGAGRPRPVEIRQSGHATWTRFDVTGHAALALDVSSPTLVKFINGGHVRCLQGWEARWASRPAGTAESFARVSRTPNGQVRSGVTPNGTPPSHRCTGSP